MNILIISFYFPPFEGVGARRWAKFGKYLDRQGDEVHVLTSQFEGNSPWDIDVEGYKDNITRLNINPPVKSYYERTLPTNLITKILWKCSLIYANFKNKKAKLYSKDISRNTADVFFKKAYEIIKEKKIEQVILSGGPFHFLQCLPKLREVTNCNYILDLRDPFTHRTELKNRLTEKQLQAEMAWERKIVDSADLVIAPCCTILEPFKNTALLPHAVDLDEYQMIKEESDLSFETIKLTFGGHLYGVTQYFELLNQFSKELSKHAKVEVNCYVPGNLVGKIDFESDAVNYLPYKRTLAEFLKEQESSNGQLYIFRALHEEGCFTTKFFELVQTKKPILYFGPKCNVSEFIEEHGLGYVVNETNMAEVATAFVKNCKTKIIPKEFDIQEHTVEHQTKRLKEIISGLNAE